VIFKLYFYNISKTYILKDGTRLSSPKIKWSELDKSCLVLFTKHMPSKSYKSYTKEVDMM